MYFSIEKHVLMPFEELLKVENVRRHLLIGIPKESDDCERRIVLTPETVGILTGEGHRVLVETNAGMKADYTDRQYSDSGACIVTNTDVYQADILFKINPPTIDEIHLMKERLLVFSFLQKTQLSEEYIRKLIEKQITAISFENMKDRFGCYPVVRSMSEIAGSVSIQIAAEYLSKSSGGKGILLGGISGVNPSEVLIVGAGTAAEFAARTALGLGALVRIFDNSIHRLQRIQANLGSRLFTSVLHPQVLVKSLSAADVVIGAVYMRDDQSDYRCITEDMVFQMKSGSVIVDLSINQGGCCETSEVRRLENPAYIRHGVIHYCVPNITSRVPRTASMAISNIVIRMILEMDQMGGITNWLKSDGGMRNGVYLLNGILTSPYIGNLFQIPFQDIHLLMTAF